MKITKRNKKELEQLGLSFLIIVVLYCFIWLSQPTETVYQLPRFDDHKMLSKSPQDDHINTKPITIYVQKVEDVQEVKIVVVSNFPIWDFKYDKLNKVVVVLDNDFNEEHKVEDGSKEQKRKNMLNVLRVVRFLITGIK